MSARIKIQRQKGQPRQARTGPLLAGLYIALAAGVLAVFSGVFDHAFVYLDDLAHIVDNRHVNSGLSWDNFSWAFGIHGPSQWHPLAWLSHQLDCALFGVKQAGPHHAVSLLLHVASVLLLFEFLRRATQELWPSALVAALFGLHPLCVESVAWASERRDVLCAVFWMLTLLAYLGYARRGGAGRYLLVVGCFALGLMSKPMLVTLPCVMLLLDFWPLGRWRVRPTKAADSNFSDAGCPPRNLAWLMLEKLPLLGLSAISSVLTVLCQQSVHAIISVQTYPIDYRLGNAILTYAIYLRKMIWPADLAVLYPLSPAMDVQTVLGAAVLLALLVGAAVALRRRMPYLLVGLLWYLGTLVPVLGLVQVGSQAYADRFTYLPLIGIYLAIAFAARDLVRRWPEARYPLAIFGSICLSLLMVVTWIQVGYWRDSQTLFEHTLLVAPNNPTIHYNLGNVLAGTNRMPEAIGHYEQALHLRSNYPEAQLNLGNALRTTGKVEEAIPHYEQALLLRKDYREAHLCLAGALVAAERPAEAIPHYRRALDLGDNDRPEVHFVLGNALRGAGRTSEAVAEYREALRLNPNIPEIHNFLGVALAIQGKLENAAAEFRYAVHLNPEYAGARDNLRRVVAKLPQKARPPGP